MKTVYKYLLHGIGEHIIRVPAGALPIAIKYFGERLCVWCIVDLKETIFVSIQFNIFGTGHEIKTDPGQFLGSYTVTDEYIFHAFWKQLP